MSLRATLYRAFEPSARDKGISAINVMIVFLVLASFLAFSLETEPTIDVDVRNQFAQFNAAIVVIFAIEYLIRLWLAGENPKYKGLTGRIRFIFTPFALADLIAFLPELVVMIVPVGDPHAASALKALRLFRLLKLARFVPAFGMLGAAFKRSGGQLAVALALALALIYVSAIALYFIEGGIQPEAFGSIPRATWWAVATLTTVGYGDAYPVTAFGKMVAAVIALAGIGVVALPAGIFASAVSDEMDARREKARQRKSKTQNPPNRE